MWLRFLPVRYRLERYRAAALTQEYVVAWGYEPRWTAVPIQGVGASERGDGFKFERVRPGKKAYEPPIA